MVLEEETGSESSFDTEGALQSISEGLGFNADDNSDATVEGAGGEDTVAGGTPAAPSKPATSAATAAPAGTPAAGPAPTTAAPKTWRPEAAATFATLPPLVQAEIHKREEDMHRGLEQYRNAASFAQQMQQAMKPYMPLMQQYKINPVNQVAALMQTHDTLVRGNDEQRMGIMLRAIKDYGLDPAKLAAALDPNNAPYTDPAVQDLTRTVQTLQSQIAQQQQRETGRVRQTLKSNIDAFANDAKNVYFNEVANDMAALLDKGLCTSLQDAYDKAIWANPVTRAKEVARQTSEATAKAQAEAKARADAARRARGANVRVVPKTGSATAPLGSIDDTLRDGLAAIRSRG